MAGWPRYMSSDKETKIFFGTYCFCFGFVFVFVFFFILLQPRKLLILPSTATTSVVYVLLFNCLPETHLISFFVFFFGRLICHKENSSELIYTIQQLPSKCHSSKCLPKFPLKVKKVWICKRAVFAFKAFASQAACLLCPHVYLTVQGPLAVFHKTSTFFCQNFQHHLLTVPVYPCSSRRRDSFC